MRAAGPEIRYPAGGRLVVRRGGVGRVESKASKVAVHLLLVRTPQGLPVWSSGVYGGIDLVFALPRGRYVAEVWRELELVRSFDLEVGSEPGRIAVP